MMNKVKTIFLGFACLWLCACSTMTNLTPTTLERAPEGVYPFEVAWDSSEESIRPDSLTAEVLMNTDSFPMEQHSAVNNRWSALVPIDDSRNVVNYRFKFLYQKKGLPQDVPGSQLSNPYALRIIDEETRRTTIIQE
jgi:hypothetical protein